MVTLPPLPALVQGRVRHQRKLPFRHGLGFTTYQWLIDIEDVPARGLFARFPASDHFDGRTPSLREALSTFVSARGERIAPHDRVLMLSAGRAFGYAFDPLTVFWCLDGQGGVRWAVLEIHNTYGERHAHLIHPDTGGRARVAKEFYVSPFLQVAGEYEVALWLDAERVSVSIELLQDGLHVFNASFTGRPVRASTWNLAQVILRTPLVALQTILRIRAHGLWLWLRRLPVVPRTRHDKPAGFP